MNISKELDGKKVNSFLPIDRMGEGFGLVKSCPKIQYYYSSEYHGDHSENCIIGRNVPSGQIVETWNVIDLSCINYHVEDTP